MGTRDKRASGVTATLNKIPPPHPGRALAIREWHIDQVVYADQSAALLNITITNAGQVRATGLCIEPEHAEVLLLELERVRHRLLDFVGGDCRPPTTVIPLPKRRTA